MSQISDKRLRDSWPVSIDDSVAKKDWGLTYDFGVQKMTKDMIKTWKVEIGKIIKDRNFRMLEF